MAEVRAVLKLVTVMAALCPLTSGCSPSASDGRKLTQEGSTASHRELARFEGLSGTIDVAGGTAHIPVMNEAVKRITSTHPEIKITVAGGGSGVGVKKVGEGLVDIGNTGRPLSDQERESHGLKSFPFAIDGVAVVVHPDNVVSDLSRSEVQRLYAGQITNWKDVGGEDAGINLFTRDEASGTRGVFWKKLLEKGSLSEAANVVSSNGAMKISVAGDPNAIGYISLGYLDETVKAVSIDGVAPTQEKAASGEYRVVRKLYMNTKGEPSGLVRAFIDYVRGPAGAEIVKEAGYIPVTGG